MTPNISNKSIYIIFIISINIVSMVCHYQPIKISSDLETERQKYYMYIDYLDEETEYSDKLDYEQFYNSIFNPEHKFSHLYNDKTQMELEINEFCNGNTFIPFQKYKRMYQIMSLGRHVITFRKCIKSDTSNYFEHLKAYYEVLSIENTITIVKLNDYITFNQKTQLQNCLNQYTESIKKIFDDLNESDFKFDFDKNIIGKHIDHLMSIVTVKEDDFFTENDKDKQLISFQYIYEEITQYQNVNENIKNVIINTSDEKNACLNYCITSTADCYKPMPEIFEGFDNYNDFIKNSKIKIKYLQVLEGPLINNKELYDIYLKNPITLDNYNELRKPIPLCHETLYSIYSLRLQKLGYVPLYKTIWSSEMEKLSCDTFYSTVFLNAEMKNIIKDIMEIEENEIIIEE